MIENSGTEGSRVGSMTKKSFFFLFQMFFNYLCAMFYETTSLNSVRIFLEWKD